MTRPTTLKKERKLRMTQDSSKLRITKINVQRDICLLYNALLSDKDQSKSNGQSMYKTRSFSGPLCQKFSDFLEQQKRNKDISKDPGHMMRSVYGTLYVRNSGHRNTDRHSIKIDSSAAVLSVFGPM